MRSLPIDTQTPFEQPVSLPYPAELPITERREEIIRAIREHQVLVITGETGSGKSTQIPKMCLEAGLGRHRLIGCTQPRRIAAITLANRVKEELGERGARWVGYKIRFQDRTVRSTRIKFMTDGILLAEAQRDRFFKAYDTLIIDEAHERTLNIDFLLGLIKKILPKRPDLKVIITSATIDPEKFSKAFGSAPMIEVSGRTYPVEVWYRPPEGTEEENGETSIVDQAIGAVDELRSRRDLKGRGDILVFMPTESDIRETVQRLEEKRYRNTLVLPLFGRLAASDQQRVFEPATQDKIVVATNVAETSITIPRIKYVIDTGLARISQYNARSRTQGLPVAPISQASGDQRKGRCGRVAAGLCIRLYSKEDFLARPLFTPPEIQRSNLAEVILRMLFLKLGNIQEFPFLDPPSPASIKDGFAVLNELGAVDDHRRLTALGRTMARLPLDPRLARMLIEANREGALREMIVLAAALSLQDPRERPLDQETQADQAHARFRDARSDFVALLKIWEAIRQKPASSEPEGSAVPLSDWRISGRGLRKFCREHFLSYRRIREWRDIHEEIRNILEELGGFALNEAPASYEAIHRAVVSGYLSHIALRKEKNLYTGTKNRQVMLFPGSGLFNKGGAWIVAAELVQTSRLFARRAATIEPEWLEEFGAHLCRSSYSEPHWEKGRGQVVAYERVTLYGLTIVERRKVNFSRLRPEEARQIFIRSALVEEDLPGRYGFMEHNRALIRRIEELESKARRRDLLVDEEALYRFYDKRLPELSDVRSLNAFIKEQGGEACLRMAEADLLQTEPDFEALEEFPDMLHWEVSGGPGAAAAATPLPGAPSGQPGASLDLPLRYAFHPGEEDDGVTAILPVHVLPRLSPAPFEWLVPGLLAEKVTTLLKALPKSLRRQLVPVGDTARRVGEALRFGQGGFYVQLSRAAFELTGVRIPEDQWDREGLPPHLKMRFEVIGPDGAILGKGRNLQELGALTVERHEGRLWSRARSRWEKNGLTAWSCGELPPQIELGTDALGVMQMAYPGLVAEAETVAVRLFENPEKAAEASREGLMRLFELAFAGELKQFRKAWIFPAQLAPALFFMKSIKEANLHLQRYIERELFELHGPQRPDRAKFLETSEKLKGRIGALGQEMLEEVLEVIREREAVRFEVQRFRQMAGKNGAILNRLQLLAEEMNRLVPSDFLEHDCREHLQQVPRYLKALRLRAERAYVAPEKDRLKAEQVLPYEKRYEELRQTVSLRSELARRQWLGEFRSMLEEYKISLYAPEIKTRFRISAKRLEEKWQEWISWKVTG